MLSADDFTSSRCYRLSYKKSDNTYYSNDISGFAESFKDHFSDIPTFIPLIYYGPGIAFIGSLYKSVENYGFAIAPLPASNFVYLIDKNGTYTKISN